MLFFFLLISSSITGSEVQIYGYLKLLNKSLLFILYIPSYNLRAFVKKNCVF